MIPEGQYCYDKNGLCPHYSIVNIEDVKIYWCTYLQQGDVGNVTDSEYKKLLKIHNTNDLSDHYSLFLLWDQVKECGINLDYEEEEV